MADECIKTIITTVFFIFKEIVEICKSKAIKIEFLVMKTTIWEMKTLLNEVNGRLDITEENISELEVKTNYQK